MMIQIVIIVSSLVLLLLPFVVPMVVFGKLNRRWVPVRVGRSASISRFEPILLLIGLSLVGILSFCGDIPGSLMSTSSGGSPSEAIRAYHYWASILFAVAALVSICIAWRISTSIAMTSLIVSSVAGLMVFETRIGLQMNTETMLRQAALTEPDKVDPATLPTMKLRFEMIDDLAGADLWINGVLLGKTPYETTVRELFQKVIPWDHEEIRKLRLSQDAENLFRTPQGNQIWRWGWCPIHFTSRPDAAMKLYYKVDFKGMRGYSSLVGQTSVGFQPDVNSSLVIKLDTVFPEWETAIDELLDRARMDDYEVDTAWLDSFDSYGSFAANKLNSVVTTEPAFKPIQTQRARDLHQRQNINDSATAWTRLMEIEEEARQTHAYDSRSPSGVMVDLLIPLLDTDQVIDHALALLRTTSKPDPWGMSYSGDGFSTGPDKSKFGEEVGLWPIAQAIWRLDQRLDAKSEEKVVPLPMADEEPLYEDLAEAIHPELDNAVEKRITPVLMQLSYLNPSRLHYAEILGGSTYERFLLRNDWRKAARRSGQDPRVGDFQNYVNPWFHKLLWLESPLGKAFRRQQSRAILKIAHDAFGEFALSTGTFSGDLNFLFLDRDFSKEHPSLGMKFWPDFDGIAKSAPKHQWQQTLRMRWDYLARLWHESTPEMFVEAFRDVPASEEYLFMPDLPNIIDAESKFDILRAVLAAEVERVGKLPADPKDYGPKYRGERNISEINNKIYGLPCKSAARKLLSDLASDPKHSWWSVVPGVLAYNTQYDDLMQLIALSDDSKLQLMILPGIERHPTPKRQQLLETLLKSQNADVRTAAAVVKQKLADLRLRVTPRRSLELQMLN
jgi:hypothetical protein